MKNNKYLILSLLSMLPLAAHADGPKWWTERGVIDAQKQSDDYAVANLGQLKFMAQQAAAEMNAKLSGGAGTAINNLVNSWNNPPANGVVRDDYAPINIGQLKAVSSLFYDRLKAEAVIAVIPEGNPKCYPWRENGDHPSHAMVANIGQLKSVFSFIVAVDPANPDSDGDGIPDAWEMQYFYNLSRKGSEQIERHGYKLTVKDAFELGLKPDNPNMGWDGVTWTEESVSSYRYNERGELIWVSKDGTERTINYDKRGNIKML